MELDYFNFLAYSIIDRSFITFMNKLESFYPNSSNKAMF